MISLIYGIYSMAQINLSTKQKQTPRYREQICACQGGGDWGRGLGEGCVGNLGLADAISIHRVDKQGSTV